MFKLQPLLKINARYRILDTGRGSTYKEYLAYLNKNRVRTERRVVGREALSVIIGCIFKHIGKELVERVGGVMIDKLGYFFVWKIPVRSFIPLYSAEEKRVIEYYNHKTKGVKYSPVFVATSNELNCWSFDNKFTQAVRSGIKHKIESGHKYKMYLHSLDSFLRPWKHRRSETKK